MNTHEQWKPAANFEGLYEVSDLGRVRNVPKSDTLGRRVPVKILTNARPRAAVE